MVIFKKLIVLNGEYGLNAHPVHDAFYHALPNGEGIDLEGWRALIKAKKGNGKIVINNFANAQHLQQDDRAPTDRSSLAGAIERFKLAGIPYIPKDEDRKTAAIFHSYGIKLLILF